MNEHMLTMGQALAALLIGLTGILVLGLQPLLYGAYVSAHLITEAQLGLVGAVEVTTIALGSGLAIPLLGRMSPFWVTVLGIGIYAAGNLFNLHEGQFVLLLEARAVAGFGGGLTVGVTIAAIARTKRVGSWMAGFQLTQAATQFAVMQVFAVAAPTAESWTIQLTFVGLSVATLLAIPFLPRALSNAANEDQVSSLAPDLHGLAGLAAMLLFMGGTVGIWAYAGLWLEGHGLTTGQAKQLLTISIAGQIAGSLFSIMFGDSRHSWARLLVLISALLVAVGFWLRQPAAAHLAFGFGLVWQATAPVFSSFLVEIDPLRRSLPFTAAAQLGGVALIPTVVGLTLGGNLDNVLAVCAIVIASSAMLVLSQIPRIVSRDRRVAGS